LFKEEHDMQSTQTTRRNALATLAYCVEVALHNTWRNKAITALMVLAIAVGIGASMTTLTVVYLLSGDPLPGRSTDIYYPQVDVNPNSKGREPYDVLDYRTAHDLWSSRRADQQTLVVSNPVKLRVGDGAAPAVIRPSISTTTDFATMFGVPLAQGRWWSREEDDARARVVVISSQLNEQMFGGRDAVGQTLQVKDTPMRIVGVLGPWRPSPLFYKVRGGRFSGGNTSGFFASSDDVFLPLTSSLEVNAGDFVPFTCWSAPEERGHLENAPCVWVHLWVKLGTATKVADYQQFLQNYAAEQKGLGRISHADNTRLRSLMQWLDFNQVVPSDVKLQAVLAFAFLGICVANVIGLLLAKFLRHSGEIGLRRALGASRGAIFLQCLAEAAIVGLLGGLAGLMLTWLGLYAVRAQPVAYADLAHLDVTMLLFTLILSILASLLASLIPAIRASAVQPIAQLKLL